MSPHSDSLLTFRCNRARNAAEFHNSLKLDPAKHIAFIAALTVAAGQETTGTGTPSCSSKLRFESYVRKQNEVIATRLYPCGELQAAIPIAKALLDAKPHTDQLEAVLRSLLSRGYEFRASPENLNLVGEVLERGLREEGVVADYLLTPDARQAARSIVSAVFGALEQSTGYQKGLDYVGRDIPIGGPSRQDSIKALSVFDRDVFVAVYILKLGIARVLESACGTSIDLTVPENRRFTGPTVTTLSALESSLWIEFFKKIPADKSALVLNRCTSFFNSFNIDRRGFAGASDNLALLELVNNIGQSLQRTLDIKHHLNSTIRAAGDLANLGLPAFSPEELRTWGEGALPFALDYSYSLPPKPGDTDDAQCLALDFSPGILSVQLRGTMGPIAAWTIDRNLNWRASAETDIIPVIPEDLDPSAGVDFASLKQAATNSALLVFDSLVKSWSLLPAIFSAKFPNTKLVRMSDKNGELKIQISSADRDLLLGAVDSERFTVTQIEDATASMDSSTFRIQYAEATLEAPPPETTLEPKPPRAINDRFISQHCHDFRALVSILGRLGVTEDTGKGSHEALMLNGHKYTTSQNLRDGTLSINRMVVRQILTQLHIPESDFIGAATGEERKSATA